MKGKKSDFFWPSYTDLMTSMFFIMLVLYILSYSRLKIKVDDLDRKLKVFTMVEENLKPLKKDTTLFRYEPDFKRYTLAFDVEFGIGKHRFIPNELINYNYSIDKIDNVGFKLKSVIDSLNYKRKANPELKDVSYLLVISGYSSHLKSGGMFNDYQLSYQRALTLWDRWRFKGIDFEAEEYKGLIDLQIAGNGWGGVGRFKMAFDDDIISEMKNQRFIIQVIPKINATL
jgi:hypothetical protein